MTDLVEQMLVWQGKYDAARNEREELRRDLANECERRDEIIASETHLRKEAEAEIARLRGVLAETVPDPEYRRMQDIEIERLRELTANVPGLVAEIERLRKARHDALEAAAQVADKYGYGSGNASPFVVAEKIRALKEKADG